VDFEIEPLKAFFVELENDPAENEMNENAEIIYKIIIIYL